MTDKADDVRGEQVKQTDRPLVLGPMVMLARNVTSEVKSEVRSGLAADHGWSPLDMEGTLEWWDTRAMVRWVRCRQGIGPEAFERCPFPSPS